MELSELDKRGCKEADRKRYLVRILRNLSLTLHSVIGWVDIQVQMVGVNEIMEQMHKKGVAIRTPVIVRRQKAQIMSVDELMSESQPIPK